MITCPSFFFEARCIERGFSRDEVRSCIVGEDGDQITVDEDHPAYPREPKPGFTPPKQTIQTPANFTQQKREGWGQAAAVAGPGTELKKLLKLVGITASPTCSCNKRARTMDTNGCDWCEANIDTIVGWLREEATKRKLPFVDMAGRILVKRAIRNARKAAS
jgi:hypothetical protein